MNGIRNTNLCIKFFRKQTSQDKKADEEINYCEKQDNKNLSNSGDENRLIKEIISVIIVNRYRFDFFVNSHVIVMSADNFFNYAIIMDKMQYSLEKINTLSLKKPLQFYITQVIQFTITNILILLNYNLVYTDIKIENIGVNIENNNITYKFLDCNLVSCDTTHNVISSLRPYYKDIPFESGFYKFNFKTYYFIILTFFLQVYLFFYKINYFSLYYTDFNSLADPHVIHEFENFVVSILKQGFFLKKINKQDIFNEKINALTPEKFSEMLNLFLEKKIEYTTPSTINITYPTDISKLNLENIKEYI